MGDKTCDATVESRRIPGHTHTCNGGSHPDDGHKCPDCDLWWWSR